MQPFNKRAQDGMQRLEKHNEGGMENTYDVEVEMGASDNDDVSYILTIPLVLGASDNDDVSYILTIPLVLGASDNDDVSFINNTFGFGGQ